MKLTVHSDFDDLLDRLKAVERLDKKIPRHLEELAEIFESAWIENLRTQGRTGNGPSLSDATLKLYSLRGGPDGSGVVDHIERVVALDRRSSKTPGKRFEVVVGVPDGEPTIIAKVQDSGATVRVSEKMRGFLAVHGIFLKQSTLVIVIPGRHSTRDAWETVRKEASHRFKRLKTST